MLEELVASTVACRVSGMQTAALTTTPDMSHRPWEGHSATVPGQSTAMYTCSTPAPQGYTVPVDQCQNFMPTAPQTFQEPIQSKMSRGASTGSNSSSAAALPEGSNYIAPRPNRVVETHLPMVANASAPASQRVSLHAVNDQHLHLSTDPYHNHVEAHQPPQPVGMPQVLSDIAVNRPFQEFEMGSALPGENLQRNSAHEEQLGLLEHSQAQGSTEPTSDSSSGAISSPIAPGVTTLVIRNVPGRYSKDMLMQEWPADGTYDFIFLPFNFKQKRTAGFAFINFLSHEAAVAFHTKWHGKPLRNQGTAKNLSVSAAGVQGLEENIRHVFALNSNRIQNTKFLPSVFNGIHEVPFADVLKQLDLSNIGDPAEQDV